MSARRPFPFPEGPFPFPESCPVNERTADGECVGRCWYYLDDGRTCPRHGDVSAAVKLYRETGELTDERELEGYP